MKARYLFSAKTGTFIDEVLSEIAILGYTIQKIKYSRYFKCDCSFGQICDCNTSTRKYKGYCIKETYDCYETKEGVIERIKTLEQNKSRKNTEIQKRIDRISNGKLNLGEKRKLKKGYTILEIINKRKNN